MATEDIKIDDGRIVVERADNKANVDVPVSDVDTVSFHRGGEADGQSDGALVLHTKNHGDVVIRVADHEAGKVLKKVYGAINPDKDDAAKSAKANTAGTNKPEAKPATDSGDKPSN